MSCKNAKILDKVRMNEVDKEIILKNVVMEVLNSDRLQELYVMMHMPLFLFPLQPLHPETFAPPSSLSLISDRYYLLSTPSEAVRPCVWLFFFIFLKFLRL